MSDSQRKPGQVTRRDGVDQRPRGIVDPVHVFGFVVGRRERNPSLEFGAQRQDPPVPKRDVPQHAGHGPVLVYLPAELLVGQAPDQRAQPLELSGVLFDVGKLGSHRPILCRPPVPSCVCKVEGNFAGSERAAIGA